MTALLSQFALITIGSLSNFAPHSITSVDAVRASHFNDLYNALVA